MKTKFIYLLVTILACLFWGATNPENTPHMISFMTGLVCGYVNCWIVGGVEL